MHKSIVERVESILSEIDKAAELASCGSLTRSESYRSIGRLTSRLEALLPRDSNAYRIFWSRTQLSPIELGFKRNEQAHYLLKWRSTILAVLNEIDPEGSERGSTRPIPLVEPPNLVVGSALVERTLNEAQALIRHGGTPGCVDRVHTALHAYFRTVARECGASGSDDASLAVCFRKMVETHPQLKPVGPRAQDIARVLKASASILDALNPVRNMATLAHPNEDLLDEAEATLVVNVARSLLTYVDTKIHKKERRAF